MNHVETVIYNEGLYNNFQTKSQNIELDLETPGALVGFKIAYLDCVFLCIADKRIFKVDDDDCLILMNLHSNLAVQMRPTENMKLYIEPEKAKRKIAFFTYKHRTGIHIFSSAETKEYAEKYCKESECELVDWPADLTKIFEV